MNIPLNPKPHTNSEMDSKQILKPNKIRSLTSEQKDQLIEQFVEIQVDNMDTKTLVQFVTDDLTDLYNDYSDEELKCQIECTHDEELYDELVDNIVNTDPTVYNTNGGKS